MLYAHTASPGRKIFFTLTLYTFFSACTAESRCADLVGFGGGHGGYLIGSIVCAGAHREAEWVVLPGLVESSLE